MCVFFQLPASKSKVLLAWWNSHLFLNYGLYILNHITSLYLKVADDWPSTSPYIDLHVTMQHKLKDWILLNVVVWEGVVIFQLLACKDETLFLFWWDFLIVLNYSIYHQVASLHLKIDDFAVGVFSKICIPPCSQSTRWTFCQRVCGNLPTGCVPR